MKELQLSPMIDPHDFGIKLGHAIDFLCEDMKVRIKLRFRGRQKAHKEFGFEVVNRFVKEAAALGPGGFAAEDAGRPRPECRPQPAAAQQARQEPPPGGGRRNRQSRREPRAAPQVSLAAGWRRRSACRRSSKA